MVRGCEDENTARDKGLVGSAKQLAGEKEMFDYLSCEGNIKLVVEFRW